MQKNTIKKADLKRTLNFTNQQARPVEPLHVRVLLYLDHICASWSVETVDMSTYSHLSIFHFLMRLVCTKWRYILALVFSSIFCIRLYLNYAFRSKKYEIRNVLLR